MDEAARDREMERAHTRKILREKESQPLGVGLTGKIYLFTKKI